MNPDHTTHHPKWYRRPVPIFWWLGNMSYVRFITRELTSVFVAYAALMLLFHLWAAARGGDVYYRFLNFLESPLVVTVHVIVLVLILWHTVTWLNLAPTALVVRIRGRRIPDAAIILAHYLGWAVVSLAVVWFVIGR